MLGSRFTPHRTGGRAFSLIEVNMAVLVVAGGLLTLITLFPAGLRMSVSSITDTRISLFSSDVLNSLRAKAATLDRSVWMASPTEFWRRVSQDTPVAGYDASSLREQVSVLRQTLTVQGEDVDYFTGTGQDPRLKPVPVRYRIRLHRERPSNVARDQRLSPLLRNVDYQTWRITIAATDRPDLDLEKINFEEFPLYHLEIRYGGQP